jgi:hypothetical protein
METPEGGSTELLIRPPKNYQVPLMVPLRRVLSRICFLTCQAQCELDTNHIAAIARTRTAPEATGLRILCSVSLWFPPDDQPPQVASRPINEMIVSTDDLESFLPKLVLDGCERNLVSMLSFGRAGTPVNDD